MLMFNSRLSVALAVASCVALPRNSSTVMPTAFNCRWKASGDGKRLIKLVYCKSASTLPATRSAAVAFCNRSWMVMSWFITPRLKSGGNIWPCAAALALTPDTISSSSLRLISKPVPLTITGSPNNAFIASAVELVLATGLTVEFAVAACAEITPAINAAERISFNFILVNWTFKFRFGSKTELQPYHFHIADVSVFLQFIQHGLRRRTVQAQHRQRQPAHRVAAQAHARDVHFMPGKQRAEMADDARLVRVVQQQQRAADGNLH